MRQHSETDALRRGHLPPALLTMADRDSPPGLIMETDDGEEPEIPKIPTPTSRPNTTAVPVTAAVVSAAAAAVPRAASHTQADDVPNLVPIGPREVVASIRPLRATSLAHPRWLSLCLSLDLFSRQ